MTAFFQFRSSSAHSSPVRDFRSTAPTRLRRPTFQGVLFFLSSASHFINPSCILQFQPTLLLPSSRLSIVPTQAPEPSGGAQRLDSFVRLFRCPSFPQRPVVSVPQHVIFLCFMYNFRIFPDSFVMCGLSQDCQVFRTFPAVFFLSLSQQIG